MWSRSVWGIGIDEGEGRPTAQGKAKPAQKAVNIQGLLTAKISELEKTELLEEEEDKKFGESCIFDSLNVLYFESDKSVIA